MSDLKEKLREIKVWRDITLIYRGHVVLDSKLTKILEEVERRGSLLAAARSQGVSYSWAWKRVNKIEELLEEQIISARKGGFRGGGASLTELGRELISIYREALTRRQKPRKESVIGGGYDPLLDKVLEPLKDKILLRWTGSVGGLAKLMVREVDVVGANLYDTESGDFNRPFLERFWLSDSTALIRGYERELGIMYRRNIGLKSISDILDKGLRYVNLPASSATRRLADSILRMEMRRMGIEGDPSKLVRGYDMQVRTHIGVAKKIINGEADVGFGTREVAESFELGFLRIMWDKYDFLILKDSLKKPSLREFLERLRSDELSKLASEMRGYRIPGDAGKIISS